MYGASTNGALELHLTYNPLQFILAACTPVIEIDGYRQTRPWGRHVVELAAGNHYLRVWFPYLFMDASGLAATQLPIHPAHVTVVRYEAPFFVTSSGSLHVMGTQPYAPGHGGGYGGYGPRA